MKTIKEWASGLQITQEKYALWLREAPAGESFTYWCLQTGKLNEEEYLGWARDFYGLPSLQPTYFSQAPNVQLWQKIQSVANWSPEFLPISEWDGVVYIACIEPHSDLKWSFPVQYVLATARDLKHLWQNLVAIDEKSFAGIPPTPDKQKLKIAPIETSLSDFSIAQINDMPANEPAAPPPIKIAQLNVTVPPDITAPLNITAPPPIDEPAGLNLGVLNKKTVNKDRDFMAELASSVKSANSSPTISKSSAFAEPPSLEGMSPLDNMPEGFAPEIAAAVPEAFSASIIPPVVTPKPAAPPPPVEVPEVPELSFHPTPAADEAPGFAATIIAPIPNTSAPSPTIAAAPHVSPLYVKFLARMQANFNGGMIIEISNDNFTPIVWDEYFKPKEGVRKVWNLNPPSAFRIAYRTGQPYVGHIVDTPTNTEFFTAWGFDTLPKSILVQPVKNIDEQTTYLLLCLSDGIKKNHQVLSEGERLGADFSELTNRNQAA